MFSFDNDRSISRIPCSTYRCFPFDDLIMMGVNFKNILFYIVCMKTRDNFFFSVNLTKRLLH